MKVTVQYTKYYSKTITKEVEVPDEIVSCDREDWVLDNAVDLFEDEITAASLSLDDEAVDFISDPRTILLLGNFTFNHFAEEEMALFKTDNLQKCLIHEITMLHPFEDRKKAHQAADDSDAPAWLILGEFKGEIVFETPKVEKRFRTFLKHNHVSYE